ncbi:MAG: tRNA uridine-5-carboxymethylaminomethyl(34) synthesis enzyme MnmG [Candidatus Babeliales bacterium]
MYDFDLIVVGGGHAGIEAAYAAARLGSRVLVITLDLDKIGLMPCNPAIGGIGKGHLVHEISALGGLMPELCTKTYLQARMLNTTKGPAVHGLRLQIDKFAYNKLSKERLEATKGITLCADTVTKLLIKDNKIVGIQTKQTTYSAPAVILTTGTFLNGTIHIGLSRHSAGRRDEPATIDLAQELASLGFELKKFKTGTTPRLLKSSLNYDKMERQEPDALSYLFEFHPHQSTTTRDCFITYTNERTHAIIRDNLHLSAMYSGAIQPGVKPPRYCPSIEDKVGRFADKNSHHIFVEPEGKDSDEVYPSGLSTSLPYEIQKQFIQSIAGFEEAVITKHGYAIEYDVIPPHEINESLETKRIKGLFLAGQLIGTTGYEEAASLGIMAGINAHLLTHKQSPFILEPHESYIGVMIKDLTSVGTDEPYRMFTSRMGPSFRLAVRQDNSFLRLTDKAFTIGLIDEVMYQAFQQEKKVINEVLEKLRKHYSPTDLLRLFEEKEDCYKELKQLGFYDQLSPRARDIIYAEIKYSPYIKQYYDIDTKIIAHYSLLIPDNWVYMDMPGLSKELQEKLTRYKPETIGHAARIPGMTPAALYLLIIAIKKRTR